MTPYDSLVHAMLSTMDGAVFLLDDAGYVQECNHAAQSVVTPASVIVPGSSIYGLLAPTLDGAAISMASLIEHAREEGHTITVARDVTLVTRDGVMDVEMRIAPTTDAGAAVVHIRDTSEYRRSREELRSLQHATNVLRAAGGLAADLAGKLTALQAHIELHADTDALEQSDVIIQRIGRALDRFVSFSKGIAPVPDETSSVAETIMDIVELALFGTPVTATFALSESLSNAYGTPEGFGQALYNVVNNGVEAMEHTGCLHIEGTISAPPDPQLRVVIRDEGHGMDQTVLTHMTGPFFTTDDGRMGMGLTVTRSILERHHGALYIDTEPGFGTTVTIELPMGQPPAIPFYRHPVSPRPISDHDIAGRNVMIVIGDPLVQRSVQKMLTALGIFSLVQPSPELALHSLRDTQEHATTPDAVICDCVLPGRMNGMNLIRRIGEINEHIPTILLCSTTDQNRGGAWPPDVEGSKDTAHTVLRKPFGMEQLRTVLVQILTNKS